jgi:trk/ktr system potassium uptake protein
MSRVTPSAAHLPRLAGVLAAAAPLLLLAAPSFHQASLERAAAGEFPSWSLGLLLLSAVVAMGGAMLLIRAPHSGRPAIMLGLVGAASSLVAPLSGKSAAPTAALVALSALAVAGHAMWPVSGQTPSTTAALDRVDRARGASLVALGADLALLLSGWRELAAIAVIGLSSLVAWCFALHAAWHHSGSGRTRAGLGGVAVIALGLLPLSWPVPGQILLVLGLVPLSALTLLQPRKGRWRTLRAVVDAVMAHPARVIAVTFLGLSLLGTLLLRLPGIGRGTIQPLDAAFTATSAVCVTGLAVLDTGADFTVLGQVVLLVLIQVGGLGIMSFSTVAIAAVGRRLSLRHEAAMADLFSGSRSELYVVVWRLLLMTLAIEAVGAGLLSIAFAAGGEAWAPALWRGLFTAVSAFCNAGFALQSDSLVAYQRDPLVLHVVALLVIAGSLSPAVIADLPRILRRRPVRAQTKIVLFMTAALLALGMAIVGGLEWTRAFGHLDTADRIHAAWFQSVTLRTAGFNSVDYAMLGPATVWIMTAFMLIGGSPGGTAGGIKTTTAFVLLVAVVGAIRGRWEAVAFGRRISHRTVYKAAAIVTIALAFVVFGVVAIVVTQSVALGPAIFEVVSALGTVGLSVGATAALDDVGKVMVMLFMFVGRIGPLTLFLFLRDRHSETPWELPEEAVDVG